MRGFVDTRTGWATISANGISRRRGNLVAEIDWNCSDWPLNMGKLQFCAFKEASMTPRNVFSAAAIGAIAFVWSGLSVADEYRGHEYQADEFLALDLSTAVLSPKPLGPATGFRSGPLDVTVDRGTDRARANAESATAPKVVVRSARVVHPPAEQVRHVAQPRLLARTKFARHHGNPLDAQAFDGRVQVWPCKSGGICNWKR
jgi:hypothetical protein